MRRAGAALIFIVALLIAVLPAGAIGKTRRSRQARQILRPQLLRRTRHTSLLCRPAESSRRKRGVWRPSTLGE